MHFQFFCNVLQFLNFLERRLKQRSLRFGSKLRTIRFLKQTVIKIANSFLPRKDKLQIGNRIVTHENVLIISNGKCNHRHHE